MKFKPSVPAAYAPAQAAAGEDPDGRPTLLLFIPQWSDVIARLALRQPPPTAETQWGFSREVELPIFFIRWATGDEVAVTFAPRSAGDVLRWWADRKRVDLIFCARPFGDEDTVDRPPEPVYGTATAPAWAGRPERTPSDAAARVRVEDVPFMTEE